MNLSEPITHAEQLTPALLTDRFGRNGFLKSGSVTSIEKTDSFGSSCAEWDRLSLTFSGDYRGDIPNAIVLKVYRKGWFGGGVIEWTFYNELAPKMPDVSVCPIFDCGFDHNEKNCHYLMPDLSVTHKDGPKEATEQLHKAVIEELLKYHIRWWNDPRLDEWPFMMQAGGPLRMAQAISEKDVRDSCASFEEALNPLAKELGDDLKPSHIEIMERVIQGYPDIFLARVANGKNITMLHGDAHLWNLFYPKNPSKDRIILFDWETYKRGLGAYDLAYMLIHGTSERKALERPLMDFYYRKLIAGGIENYSRDQFEYDYRLSVLSCVFCPILWKRAFSVRNAMKAYKDWDCGALLR